MRCRPPAALRRAGAGGRQGILWLPYRKGPKAHTREIALDAPGWAVVGYSRAQALAERAVLPVTFGALDGEATWRDEEGRTTQAVEDEAGRAVLRVGWPDPGCTTVTTPC